jgi:hypothetical protein
MALVSSGSNFVAISFLLWTCLAVCYFLEIGIHARIIGIHSADIAGTTPWDTLERAHGALVRSRHEWSRFGVELWGVEDSNAVWNEVNGHFDKFNKAMTQFGLLPIKNFKTKSSMCSVKMSDWTISLAVSSVFKILCALWQGAEDATKVEGRRASDGDCGPGRV